MLQLSFLPSDEYRITVYVTQEGVNRWSAVIAGGWWMAYGKSKAEAMKNVMIRFLADANTRAEESDIEAELYKLTLQWVLEALENNTRPIEEITCNIEEVLKNNDR